MMKQSDQIIDTMNISMARLLTNRTIDEQCAAISEWLTPQYQVDVIGFFLKESETIRAYDYRQSSSMSKTFNPDDLLQTNSHTEHAKGDIFLLPRKMVNWLHSIRRNLLGP